MKKLLLFVLFIVFTNLTFGQEAINVFDIARKGSVEQVKEILKTNPKAFHVVNEDGFSPLVLATYRGNNEVAKLLITSGSDVNGNTKMGTPLMAAVVKGNDEIAKLLIANKADINASDANGTTALIYTVQFQNPTLLKLLLDNKVDKSHKDKEGKTAFEHAVFSRNEEIINLLK